MQAYKPGSVFILSSLKTKSYHLSSPVIAVGINRPTHSAFAICDLSEQLSSLRYRLNQMI